MIALRQTWMFQATVFAVLASMTLMLTACDEPRVAGREVGFEIEPSRTNVLVGENVTVMARSENILGREAQIEWDASGGELFTEERGRLARVYFDEPGEYNVQANLILDGRLARSDTVTITVDDVD